MWAECFALRPPPHTRSSLGVCTTNGCKGTHLEEISGRHESHERFNKLTKSILVIRGCVTTDLRKSFEDAHHAGPVLCNESTCLNLDLLIMHPTREDSRNDDAKDRKEKVVVATESVRVVNVCDC